MNPSLAHPAADRGTSGSKRSPAAAPAVHLEIARLTKRFGSFVALENVSFQALEGELVCFLGPSGCGKTTLLRAIAGLEPQSEGRVIQAGRDVSALPPAERDFGIVFQSYALFPNLTVARNVGYGLENRRLARAALERRVAELLELVGLPDQGAKYPAQLSGGQQQRVALARALATSPGLLLLDEPLSALDAKVRVHLRTEIRQLQRRLGVTTIMVTHDQEEAMTMADRIVVMDRGRIEQVGSPLEIYREPASPFVADFIGAMNFLDGTVSGRNRVRVGSLDLRTSSNGADGPVLVAIRPEDVLLQEADALSDNAMLVRIQRLEFLGSFFRAYLQPVDAPGLALRADISVHRVRRTGLHEGGTLPVGLPADRLRIYPRVTAGGDSH